MRRLILAAVSAACVSATPAIAQDRVAIGNGRLFTNDYLGDGHDRWRTGSYVYSHLRAREAFSGTPAALGDIIEYRFRGEIIAPRAGIGPAGERPYVGALSLGLHTHYNLDGMIARVGADVIAVGPQTGLDDFQNGFHDALSLPDPSQTDQHANDFFLSATAELSQTFTIGENISLRPFAELQTGVEEVVRFGGDVMIGQVAQSDLMLRDVVTGQLYRGTHLPGNGFSYVVGGDVAAIGGSEFLPGDQGYIASDTRTRARAGVHYQASDDVSFFYGMTYLSEEFEGQPEGQVVGSLKLNFNF
jgi:hypothetical protein